MKDKALVSNEVVISMRVYIISYLIIAYVVNTVFVYTFSSLLGQMYSQDFFEFLASSIYYVFPYTLINFVLTGIVTCYLMRLVLEKRRLVAAGALLMVLLLDLLIFVQFFNNSELLIMLVRVGFVVASYWILYFTINFNRFLTKQ